MDLAKNYDRVKTLSDISGLNVTYRLEKGENVYDFYLNGNTVKTCFTYPKAKVFAEGIEIGKKLGSVEALTNDGNS